MSDYGDNDRDYRSSRDRRPSPNGDSGSSGSHASSSKPQQKSGSKELPNIGKKAAEKSGGLFSPEDWMCKSCGNINWARRSTCNMCNMPKYQKAEARTGAGGGYNERDNVEYNERHNESDGEYDEFGRRKKKARNPNESEETKRSGTDSKSRSLGEDDDDDDAEESDDEDDEFDAKKYALDSDDDDDPKDNKNHQQASSSNDKRSNRSDRGLSPTNRKRSSSPHSSRRNDDQYTRRRSRSRSPVSSSKHKSYRH